MAKQGPQPRWQARRRGAAIALATSAFAVIGLAAPAGASSGGGRRVSDADSTRTVYLVVAALVLLAAGLAAFTWWFWRATRREHESLAPLEVMGAKKFTTGDPAARQTLLDGSRPVGAQPLAAGGVEPLILDDVEIPGLVPAVAAAAAVVGAENEVEAAREDATTMLAIPAEEAAGMVDGEAADDEVLSPDAAEVAASASVPPVAADGDAEDADEQPASEAADVVAGEPPTELIEATAAEPEPEAETDVEPELEPELDLGILAATRPVSTNGRGASVASSIDPGLPQPPDEVVSTKQLSLAELASLDGGPAADFDDDGLTATPSTGIPVIESAEAWLERQLRGAAANGDASPSATAADPD
jgi:hypothetical protein